MHPRCTEFVSLPERQGKPPKFCSASCRDNYYRERSVLTAKILEMERYASTDRGLLAKLRWHLLRYPPLEPILSSPDPVPETSLPPAAVAEPSWLTRLLGDLATSVALAGNPEVPPEILYELHLHPDPTVRANVAANPGTPPHVLEALTADPAPRVREHAARNEFTPNEARDKVGRDRSRRVRQAAQTGSLVATRSRNIKRHHGQYAQAIEPLRNPQVFADTLNRYLTHTLTQALNCSGNDGRIVASSIEVATAPLRDHEPRLIPTGVIQEWLYGDERAGNFRVSSTLAAGEEATNAHPMAVPLISTWVEAIIDLIATCYEIPVASLDHSRVTLTRLFAELHLSDPLTSADVHSVPHLVMRYSHPQGWSM